MKTTRRKFIALLAAAVGVAVVKPRYEKPVEVYRDPMSRHIVVDGVRIPDSYILDEHPDLTEVSLEALLDQVSKATNDRGETLALQPKYMMVSKEGAAVLKEAGFTIREDL